MQAAEDLLKAERLLEKDKHSMMKARTIATALGTDALMLAGKTRLRQFAALLAACDAFVTTDTGPMHIAFAIGVPTVVLSHCAFPASLLGPTFDPERHRLIQLEPQAAATCGRHLSMGQIQSDCVWGARSDILVHARGHGTPDR